MTRHTSTKEPKPIDSIFDIRARLQDSFNRVNGMLKVMESNASTEKVRLQLSAELRHHIAMAEKTLAGAYRAEAVDYFIDCVMEAFQALGPIALQRWGVLCFLPRKFQFTLAPHRLPSHRRGHMVTPRNCVKKKRSTQD